MEKRSSFFRRLLILSFGPAYRQAEELKTAFQLHIYPWVTVNPQTLLGLSRAEVLMRVKFLQTVHGHKGRAEETIYFQYSGDQDRGVLRNPYEETRRLLACVEASFSGNADAVNVCKAKSGKGYECISGEDELAAAIYLKRTKLKCKLVVRPDNFNRQNCDRFIQDKTDFYMKCCEDENLRQTIQEIRSIHYHDLYTGKSDLKRVALDAAGNIEENAVNFQAGARVVQPTRSFYQGHPALGIMGERPSEIRFMEYGLSKYLTGNEVVLDLGCNVGFFALFLSQNAKYVQGIEANKDFVAIGNIAKRYLAIANCDILCTKYENMVKDRKYDLILSCNFHYYLNISAATYLEQLLEMLNPAGMILFETATTIKPDLSEGDLSELNNLAISEIEDLVLSRRVGIIRQGVSSSNHVCLRRYTLLRKEPFTK